MAEPVLLLTTPNEGHPFDAYLEEILLCEGYNCFERMGGNCELGLDELLTYQLVIVSCGAAGRIRKEALRAYVEAGGRTVVFRPPRDWDELFGLVRTGETYSTAVDAYLSVDDNHPWLSGFPARELQCLGESHVYHSKDAEALAYLAGQLGCPSRFPAVALKRLGHGAGVVFAYDLVECVVLMHQGRPENSSTGTNPDANRDGKYCGDDALEGLRDFRLRHIPQADVHQDLLVRVIRGLTADSVPLPRLWHFPGAAPGAFLIDGDGDGMNWEDLMWVVDKVERHEVKYTFYLMDQQIEAFHATQVDGVRARGHEFGPHPWIGLKPTIAQWEEEIQRITSWMRSKFGFEPQSLRSHSCIFPGWDETPRTLVRNGLRLDTNYANLYRYVSGYANGSALPVKFIGRDGDVIDCYEQSTVQTEDGAFSPKTLLPELTEEQAWSLSDELIKATVQKYHGVYHPYYHPLSLRQDLHRRWFSEILRQVDGYGLLNLSSREWLEFNDARRVVEVRDITWNPETLRIAFSLCSPLPVRNLTVLLPLWYGASPDRAAVNGQSVSMNRMAHEEAGWFSISLSVGSGDESEIEVSYKRG